jgi:hypothetical protein
MPLRCGALSLCFRPPLWLSPSSLVVRVGHAPFSSALVGPPDLRCTILHTHTHTHSCTLAHTHTRTHTHTYTLMHSCTHMHTRARLWVRGGNALFICIGVSPLVVTNVFKTYAHARAHTHTHAHARTRTYSPTCTHTHTYTRIHTHAHTPACRPPACGDLDGRSSVDHNPISAAAAAARCGCAQLLFVQ